MGTNRKDPAEAGTGRKKRAREIYAERMADRLDRLIAAQRQAREAAAAAAAAAAPAATAEHAIRLSIGGDSFDVTIQATAAPCNTKQQAGKAKVLWFPVAD